MIQPNGSSPTPSLGFDFSANHFAGKGKKRGEEKKKEGCRYFETHQTSWIRKKAHGCMVILNIAHSLKSDVLRKSMKVCYSLVDDKTKTVITNGYRAFVKLMQKNFDELIVSGQSIEVAG